MMGREKNMGYHLHFEDVGFEFELPCDLGQVTSPWGPQFSFVGGLATWSLSSYV